MLHVATVIAPREVFRLTRRHATGLAGAIEAMGRRAVSVVCLGQDAAWDVIFDGEAITSDALISSGELATAPIDIIVQNLERRGKDLFVADMDSTIIGEECIDEIADVLGLKEKVAPITEAAMQGKLDFKAALRERVALLKGISKSQLQQVYDQRIHFNPGAKTLIATLKAEGIKTALVSGGFTFFTDQVSNALGFDFVRANHLGFDGNVLDGTVAEPILDGQGKKSFLEDLAGGAPETALALGDGANDIPMFGAAGFSLCYHGKPVANEAAAGRLRHVDLSGVLYALGIPEEGFRR